MQQSRQLTAIFLNNIIDNNDASGKHKQHYKINKMKLILIFCLSFMYLLSYSQYADDSVAIIKLLKKGSVTFRSGDAKGYADCWKIEPYSIILVSSADGKVTSMPAEEIAKTSPYMGQGGFATTSNYKMSIHGDYGWTSFDEIATAKDGTKSYSYEIWMVEKNNGEWKLVAASMHFYKKP